MATSLAEILADLRHEAVTSPRNDPAAIADARAALGRLRPALDRLRDEGLDTGASIDTDPDAFSRQADRVHWVLLLAATCSTLGHSVPEFDSPGRLTNLADAAAVASTVQSDTATSGERWATAAALARTARHLTSAAMGGDSTPEVDRALIIAEASASVLFQFAALDPPTAAHTAALHRPVPNPTAEATSIADAALNASAALVHSTRPGTGPHSIADMLAIATAAATVCASVGGTVGFPKRQFSVAHAQEGIRAWNQFREQLAPFNDGSRRPHTGRPQAVHQAQVLYQLFQPARPSALTVSPTALSRAVMATIMNRLDTVAHQLDSAVESGLKCRQFMAYAADLPYRDSRIEQYLKGHRASGLITADEADLAPVRAAFVTVRRAMTRITGSLAPSSVVVGDANAPSERHQPVGPSPSAVTPRR